MPYGKKRLVGAQTSAMPCSPWWLLIALLLVLLSQLPSGQTLPTLAASCRRISPELNPLINTEQPTKGVLTARASQWELLGLQPGSSCAGAAAAHQLKAGSDRPRAPPVKKEVLHLGVLQGWIIVTQYFVLISLDVCHNWYCTESHPQVRVWIQRIHFNLAFVACYHVQM